MSDFGQTIHQLRVSRSISQEELAAGIFNRSRLSRIESGSAYPSQQVANQLISRLSLTPKEFEYIQHDYSASKKDQILYQFFNLKDSTETKKINLLIKQCNSIRDDNDIKRIKKILQAQLLLGNPDDLERAKKLVQSIWYDHLANIKVLTIIDLYLLNMIAYAFDNKTSQQIITKILNAINKHYPFLKSLKCSILINQASLSLEQHDFNAAKASLIQAAELAQKNNQYDKLLLCKSELAICNKDNKQATYYANLLNEIGASELAQLLKIQIKQFSYFFN
ncbi:helix-turn-helix transcriptional regulator [Lactobacillus sp. ESL0731]|uniref:helix-turn-helix domain-containing protein n=1 Tax=unclassified Lactobacillus TaxID=2620435 RepID=UPI0023F70BD6|nr:MULTISPECIES: helix-turn-helix transcriptional regulator [unclassified Lactobacillus]WEV50626.1 helix-turn-helix transcriptional regulator [Lactobacillus sp. ESL0700]WEV61756.1 helix-turn-helix transcriptional regulator [Lactobacillus sp. ESL0731]